MVIMSVKMLFPSISTIYEFGRKDIDELEPLLITVCNCCYNIHFLTLYNLEKNRFILGLRHVRLTVVTVFTATFRQIIAVLQVEA